jgi:hypothetical protein
VSPAINVGAVDPSSNVAITFSEAMTANSIAVELRDPANVLVAGSGAYTAATRTYTFTPTAPLTGLTTYTAKVVAAKDSTGQAMAAASSWSFTTAGAAGTMPTSIWTSATVPSAAASTETSPIELGLRFKSDVAGKVSGVRFYKSQANQGTHLGRLWSAAGALLGTVTFTNESATGWQQANFATPIAIAAGQTYVVSFYSPQGGYYADAGFFNSAEVVRGPLHALSAATGGANGVFLYAAGGGFPSGSWGNANYWVDLMFAATPVAPSVVDRSPAPSVVAVAPASTVTATFDVAINPATLVFTLTGPGGAVASTTAWNATTKVATLTPNAPLAPGVQYNVNLGASALNGGAAMQPVAWSFTTATPVGSFPATIWDSSAVPAQASTVDGSSVELGVKFLSDIDGSITAIRFYKGPNNTGQHVGHLWAANGNLLGTAVFGNESATGWQQANFAASIPIAAGQTYVASYLAPAGGYAVSPAGLAASADRAPLHALASGASGGNGVFAYGPGGFPNGSYNATNYWVDVVFADSGAPTVIEQSPVPQATGVALNSTVTARFGEAVQPATISFVLRDGQGAVVASTTSYDGPSSVATLTPTGALNANATYTATVSGAKDLTGNAMTAPYSWSFSTTVSASAVSLFGTTSPATASANDPSAIEVGMKFRAAVDGTVRGVRFFKGPTNGGVHVGHLWAADGTLLGTANFTSESPNGWQSANFASPVPITAGTIYVVSYYAPTGGYAVNPAYFNPGDFTNGPLTGVGNFAATPNGVFLYGAGGGFPSGSYGGSNYWVDVLFVPAG